jgi:hypothetical protein
MPARAAAEDRQSKELAEEPNDPAAVPAPAAGADGSTALAFLRGLLPERFAATTAAGLREITELDLRGAKIGDQDLVHLRALPNLASLNLRGTEVTDAGLHHLAALPKLEVLTLRGTAVTGTGLASLPVSLHHVDLTDTRAGAGSLAALPPLPNLATLKLNRLPVGDADLEVLPRWQQLRHLEIDGTRVTEAGVRRLLELHPLLTRVEIRGVTLSPELIGELRRRYPQLDLVADAGGVGFDPRGR